ncbi:MAG: hypothetical protein JW395_2724 [Nitrospira sp.]|nr:hypothetical protein [Nitrospira sp.]
MSGRACCLHNILLTSDIVVVERRGELIEFMYTIVKWVNEHHEFQRVNYDERFEQRVGKRCTKWVHICN